MNSVLQNQEEENINIKKYIQLFLDNWRWFVATIIITVSIAFCKQISAPKFESQHNVFNENETYVHEYLMKNLFFGCKTQILKIKWEF
jgi:hypothetical protein